MDDKTKKTVGEYAGIFVSSATLLFILWFTGTISFNGPKETARSIEAVGLKTSDTVQSLLYLSEGYQFLGVEDAGNGIAFFHYLDNPKRGWGDPLYYRTVSRHEKVVLKSWKFLGMYRDNSGEDRYVFQVPKPEEN